jgi:cobalamin biosynthesis Mg chelatase CobN
MNPIKFIRIFFVLAAMALFLPSCSLLHKTKSVTRSTVDSTVEAIAFLAETKEASSEANVFKVDSSTTQKVKEYDKETVIEEYPQGSPISKKTTIRERGKGTIIGNDYSTTHSKIKAIEKDSASAAYKSTSQVKKSDKRIEKAVKRTNYIVFVIVGLISILLIAAGLFIYYRYRKIKGALTIPPIL